MKTINTFFRVLVCSLFALVLAFAFIAITAFMGIGWAAGICAVMCLIPLIYLLLLLSSFSTETIQKQTSKPKPEQ